MLAPIGQTLLGLVTRGARPRATLVLLVAALATTLLAAPAPLSGQATDPEPDAAASGWTLIGWNNLGMHCLDADFSVLAILPPYNTIQAQLIDPTGRLVTSPAGIKVTYRGVADPTRSINTTSARKTNFWSYVLPLFGVSLPVNVGLLNHNMPGRPNRPQPMVFDPAMNWFIAEGIPITPYDNRMKKNYYPMMRLAATDAAGRLLASTRIVLPVSDEMDCAACHASGSGDAAKPKDGWVYDRNKQRDYRLNILRLHDDRQLGTTLFDDALVTKGYDAGGLYATATGGKPILCAGCHLSEALAGSGLPGIPPLTAAVHTLHGSVVDPTNGLPLDESANRSACYRCHPGSATRCLRGAMGHAVAADGTFEIQCQDCHGRVTIVGDAGRTGWLQEPACQNCHTGTAVLNSGAIRFTSAFDVSGLPREPADRTFATNQNTPAAGLSLYRFSTGHGDLQCAACHGSTHAESPSSHRNDNIQSIALQGHVGTLSECPRCHHGTPATVNGGPHGMHPVGDAWVFAHSDAAEHGTAACQPCHGLDYRGTVLSYAFAPRTFRTEFGIKAFFRGAQIGCYACHNGPSGEDANPNRAPVAQNRAAKTQAGTAVVIPLVATDADGDPLTLRIVSQPANGTVGLSGTTATYFPFPGFVGKDSFTFAAWDGSISSNLATVKVQVTRAP